MERSPLHEPHRDVEDPTHLPDSIHLDDVRVVEPGHEARLPFEPLGGGGSEPQLGEQHLQRDGPLERDFRRLEDGRHPAAAELALYLVVTGKHEAEAGKERIRVFGGQYHRGGRRVGPLSPAVPTEPRAERDLPPAMSAGHRMRIMA